MEDDLGQFIFNNLEYVISILGAGGFILFLKLKKHRVARNNLTQKLIMLKKRKEQFNKKVKSVF
jgi:hypothetical protein